MKEHIKRLDHHISKREQFDRGVQISILNNQLWYWTTIKGKLLESKYPTRFKEATAKIEEIEAELKTLQS